MTCGAGKGFGLGLGCGLKRGDVDDSWAARNMMAGQNKVADFLGRFYIYVYNFG